MTDADDNIQFKLFDAYFAGLPVATTPVGTPPTLVLQGGTTKQTPFTTGRTILTANQNYYVAVGGSDSNNGLSPGSAWATLQNAMNVMAMLDFGSFTVTVNIGAGSFSGVNVSTTIGGGNIIWNGAGSSSTKITAGTVGAPATGEVFLFGNITDTIHQFTGLKIVGPVNNSGTGALGVFAAVSFFLGLDVVFDVSGVTDSISYMIWNQAAGASGFDLGFTVVGGGATINSLIRNDANATYTNLDTGDPTAKCLITGGLTAVSGIMQAAGGRVNTDPATGSGGWAFSGGTVVANPVFCADGGIISRLGLPYTLGPNWFPGTLALTVDPDSIYDGQQGPLPRINTQTGSSYTLAATMLPGGNSADPFKIIEMNNAGANTVTVPTNASQAFPIGTEVWVTQTGAGATTIAGAGGVTVDNAGLVGGQWKSVKLYKRGTNEWVQTNA